MGSLYQEMKIYKTIVVHKHFIEHQLGFPNKHVLLSTKLILKRESGDAEMDCETVLLKYNSLIGFKFSIRTFNKIK